MIKNLLIAIETGDSSLVATFIKTYEFAQIKSTINNIKFTLVDLFISIVLNYKSILKNFKYYSLSDITIPVIIRNPPTISNNFGISLKNITPKMVAPIGSPRIVKLIKIGEKNFKQ